jgi:hypothetical protein
VDWTFKEVPGTHEKAVRKLYIKKYEYSSRAAIEDTA